MRGREGHNLVFNFNLNSLFPRLFAGRAEYLSNFIVGTFWNWAKAGLASKAKMVPPGCGNVIAGNEMAGQGCFATKSWKNVVDRQR